MKTIASTALHLSLVGQVHAQDNSAAVQQTGTGHTSTTDQLGSGNRGVVFQR